MRGREKGVASCYGNVEDKSRHPAGPLCPFRTVLRWSLGHRTIWDDPRRHEIHFRTGQMTWLNK